MNMRLTRLLIHLPCIAIAKYVVAFQSRRLYTLLSLRKFRVLHVLHGCIIDFDVL